MPRSRVASDTTEGYGRTLIKGFIALLFTLLLIFLAAGRLDYWQGWVFSAITVLSVVVESVIFAKKPDLVKERLRPGPGTKWWDKIFFAFFVPVNLSIVIIGGLDTGRLMWTSRSPAYVYTIGYAFFGLSSIIKCWAMWTNRFFSSTVRIQMDRGHEVVQDGPYRFVRHPGYVAGSLLAIGMALALGSLWALIPAGFTAILLLVRTSLEDTTLQKELAGYGDYAKKVRYRLLPGVW